MLQGLVIRRSFVTVEVVLVLFILISAGIAATRFLHLTRAGNDLAVGPLAALPGDAPSVLTVVKPRAEYERIVTSKLFGTSGQTKKEAAAPPAPPPVEEVISDLKLKLCGTAALTPKDPLATAIIINQEKGTPTMRTYCIDQDVVDQVTLEEIYPRKVILNNKRPGANRREVLLMDEQKGDTTLAAAGGPPKPQPPAPPPSSPNRVTVKKAELIQEVFSNYTDLVTQIKPEMYRDPNGNVAGITASNLESVPLAKKLGVHDGDVLQTVNNELIDSEEKVYELVQKYRNANSVRIGLLRDGKPIVVTYKLE